MKDNPIAAWLKENGRTTEWLAKQVGTKPGWLSSVGNRKRPPSSILAASLERITGIPASVWGEGMSLPETKLSAVKADMAAQRWGDALLKAAKFADLGDEKAHILKAREALLRPVFQRQIGRDPDALIAAGVAALRRRYGDV